MAATDGRQLHTPLITTQNDGKWGETTADVGDPRARDCGSTATRPTSSPVLDPFPVG
eukprot:CAMPEP_0204365882 /NCGR_PEP_ID=MMETSP0469-20131031/42246_1 /ASSEMBLY_ACC=CAM_ASM_000384 /TAXON_ID=2969 /ORGANISM="Oxyrrhis marina" /LENGTH=56 /DNA_ID=CAMNT_0051354995 /DNA_START=228 /DNA_END=394 /DNA_ORIENTATION=+